MGARRAPSAKWAPFAANFSRRGAEQGGAEARPVGGWGCPGRPAGGVISRRGCAIVGRCVTFSGKNRASPIGPGTWRRRFSAGRAPGANLVLVRGTSAEFTAGASCLVARIRGCRRQGCAADNLGEVARSHAWPFRNTPTRPPRQRDISTLRQTQYDTLKKVRARRPLFSSPVFPTGSRLSLFASARSQCGLF